MPYISELLGNWVTDSSDSTVGRLEDILISPKNESFSPLEFLVVKTKGGELKFVPYSFVENFNTNEIRLKNLFDKISNRELPKQAFIYLKKEVLDRQIVDVSGTRVVRVDDLRIGNFEGKTSVLAIDTSFRALMRRLGFESFIPNKLFEAHLIDWRQAQLLDHGPVQLNLSAENFKRLHPADLANIVEDLDVKRGSTLLSALDEKEAAKVLEELDTDDQNIIMKYLGPDKAGKILAQMSSDEIVDLAKTFSKAEAPEYLSQLGGKVKNIQKLIHYGDNTAGGLMSLDFVTVKMDWTVAEAVAEIKAQSSNFRSIFFVYVVSENDKFEGVVSLRRLLVNDPTVPIRKIVKTFRVPALLKTSDRIQKIIQIMTRYNLYTAAVLDREKKLVGVVTIDDVMRQLFPTA